MTITVADQSFRILFALSIVCMGIFALGARLATRRLLRGDREGERRLRRALLPVSAAAAVFMLLDLMTSPRLSLIGLLLLVANIVLLAVSVGAAKISARTTDH